MRTRICLLVDIVSMLLSFGCVKKHSFTIPSDSPAAPAFEQNDSESGRIEPKQEQNPSSDNTIPEQQAPADSLPDLVPAAIFCDVTDFPVGQEIYFDTGIRNDGTVDSYEFNIKWFVNDVEEGYGGHRGVPAGYNDISDNSQFYWTPKESGSYIIRFTVDCDNYIVESNEDNNSIDIIIVVP